MNKKKAVKKLLKKLFQIRKDMELSQAEFGEKLGDMVFSTISKWERGNHRPTNQSLYKILRFLNERTDDVIRLHKANTFIDTISNSLWFIKDIQDDPSVEYAGDLQESFEGIDYNENLAPSIDRIDDPEGQAERSIGVAFVKEPEEIERRFQQALQETQERQLIAYLFKIALQELLKCDKETDEIERNLTLSLASKMAPFESYTVVKEIVGKT